MDPLLPPAALDHLPAHPRLYGNAARWEALRTQVETDPASAQIHALLMRQADGFLSSPPVVYEKEGIRLLGPVREGRTRIVTLAAAARLTGEAQYRERAVAEMRALAALPDWNPSHFLDTAEATGGLALGYDWLHDDLSPADRQLFEDAILRNGLRTSFDAPEHYLRWVEARHNWNQVCQGGLVMGALAVAERDPALARRVIERAAANLHHAAEAYAPDGAYPEGPMYWAYGTTYHVLLVDALRSVLGTTLDLEKFPGFLASVDYRRQMIGPTGLFFDYADGRERPTFNIITFWFARELRRPDLWQAEMPFLASSTGPKAEHLLYILPLLWRQPDQDRQAAPAEGSGVTRRLWRGRMPVTVLRSASDDPRAVYIGFKAGSCHVNHAHMDVGSFVLDADGVRWAVDPGMQEYYSLESQGAPLWDMSGPRFDIFRLGPDAHNILRFDGARQQIKAIADFDGSRLDGPDPFVTADLTEIYADKVAAARRGVCLRADRRVLLQDEWTAGPAPVEVAWQWLTHAEAAPDAHGVTLRQDGQCLRLQVAAPEKFTVAVEDASQPVRPYDVPNPGLKRIVVRTTSPAGKPGRITVVAEPSSATGTLPENWAARPLAEW